MAHRPARFALLVMILGLLTPLVGGCAPWVTYPQIEGAGHFGSASFEPVPSIITEAIRYTNERSAKLDPLVFNLPQGSRVEDYDRILLRLGAPSGVHPMREAGERAIHVTQIRVRAADAEVDVVYPRTGGLYETATLSMRQRLFGRFEVQRMRVWRVTVHPPLPTYPPDPVAPQPAGEMDPYPYPNGPREVYWDTTPEE
ncbi:MAG TPA: hypothetical protein PK098_12700 [Phycisphaerales bacterium]|nr:hypothetical protein [Phycisphaerales bacterium]